jgi:hypothetical protein
MCRKGTSKRNGFQTSTECKPEFSSLFVSINGKERVEETFMQTTMSNISKINSLSDKFVAKDVKRTDIPYLCKMMPLKPGLKTKFNIKIAICEGLHQHSLELVSSTSNITMTRIEGNVRVMDRRNME